jgi:two-component system chemotaxis response regulator CheB
VSPAGRELRVLVVDDSAVVRMAMAAIFAGEPGVSLQSASDPILAFDKMSRWRPDVIVLDLELPRMDGLQFLHRVMASDPIPVVVCSGLAQRGTEAALHAVEAGAVAVIAKPQLDVQGFLLDAAVMLRDTVRGAAQARLRPRGLPRASAPRGAASAASTRPVAALRRTTDKVVAIGASTGGTEALRALLEQLPPETPGLVIVQHMPEVFTRAFADRLDKTCRLEVREACNGDRVLEGRALIAPGNRHLSLRRSGGHYEVEVGDGPLVSRHRPSVDVLFHSAAAAAGANAVGVILTGMGGDGAEGLLAMRRAGAFTLAQDEASCVVFGMPKEAIQKGAVEQVVPLAGMASAILRGCAALDRPEPLARERRGCA